MGQEGTKDNSGCQGAEGEQQCCSQDCVDSGGDAEGKEEQGALAEARLAGDLVVWRVDGVDPHVACRGGTAKGGGCRCR